MKLCQKFRNSVRPLFLTPAKESEIELLIKAAEGFVAYNVKIRDIYQDVSSELYRSWAEHLVKEKGVNFNDGYLKEHAFYKQLDETTFIYFLYLFISFGAGLREIWAADNNSTNMEMDQQKSPSPAELHIPPSSEKEIFDEPKNQSMMDLSNDD